MWNHLFGGGFACLVIVWVGFIHIGSVSWHVSVITGWCVWSLNHWLWGSVVVLLLSISSLWTHNSLMVCIGHLLLLSELILIKVDTSLLTLIVQGSLGIVKVIHILSYLARGIEWSVQIVVVILLLRSLLHMLVDTRIESLSRIRTLLRIVIRSNCLITSILRQDGSSKWVHLLHMWSIRSHIGDQFVWMCLMERLTLLDMIVLILYQLLHILVLLIVTHIWALTVLAQLRIVLDSSRINGMLIMNRHILTWIATKVAGGMMWVLLMHLLVEHPCIRIMKWVINSNNTSTRRAQYNPTILVASQRLLVSMMGESHFVITLSYWTVLLWKVFCMVFDRLIDPFNTRPSKLISILINQLLSRLQILLRAPMLSIWVVHIHNLAAYWHLCVIHRSLILDGHLLIIKR